MKVFVLDVYPVGQVYTQDVMNRKNPVLQAEQSLLVQTVQLVGHGWHVKSGALKVLIGQLRTHVKLVFGVIVANPVGISVLLTKKYGLMHFRHMLKELTN